MIFYYIENNIKLHNNIKQYLLVINIKNHHIYCFKLLFYEKKYYKREYG